MAQELAVQTIGVKSFELPGSPLGVEREIIGIDHAEMGAALADPRYTATTVTRAFSGRPARGLINEFIVEHADAPPAYPELNNATRPLRAAAAARGDTERMSLWAGQGYRLAAELPAAEIIGRLRG